MPSFFPEGNQPQAQDTEHRLLAKIASGIDASSSGASSAAATRTVAVKTVADVGVPEAMGAAGFTFRTVIFWGMKAAKTNNTGTVYLQVSSTNDQPGSPLPTGQGLFYTAPAGKTLKGTDFYIDVLNAGDGVLYDAVS